MLERYLTTHELIAHIELAVGYRLRLKPHESIRDIRLTNVSIVVAVNRVSLRPHYRDWRITERRVELLSWVRTDVTEPWLALVPTVVRWSTDELHTSSPPRLRDSDWEEMCYRPGSEIDPRDTRCREDQKRVIGY